MPSPIAYPFTAGARHAFVSIELKFNGQIYIGIKSINYSRKRSRVFVRGNHPDPLGKTRGSNEYACDFEMYLAEWNFFQAAMISFAQQSNFAYGDVQFQILVSYTENGLDQIQDIINGCTIDLTDASQSQSDDPLIRKVECNPLKIFFGGTANDDVSVSLQAPAA